MPHKANTRSNRSFGAVAASIHHAPMQAWAPRPSRLNQARCTLVHHRSGLRLSQPLGMEAKLSQQRAPFWPNPDQVRPKSVQTQSKQGRFWWQFIGMLSLGFDQCWAASVKLSPSLAWCSPDSTKTRGELGPSSLRFGWALHALRQHWPTIDEIARFQPQFLRYWPARGEFDNSSTPGRILGKPRRRGDFFGRPEVWSGGRPKIHSHENRGFGLARTTPSFLWQRLLRWRRFPRPRASLAAGHLRLRVAPDTPPTIRLRCR